MERSNNFMERQKEDVIKYINEAFENTSKSPKVNFKLPASVVHEQEVLKEIMDKYNKQNSTDFQNSLKELIKPAVQDKVQRQVSEHDDIEQAKNLEIKEVQKQGIEVDNVDLSEAKEKSEQTGTDLQAAILVAIYEETLQSYYKLKLELQQGYNGQLQTGDLSLPEKQSTELVLYENYLRKIDMNYRARTGNFIVKEDDGLQKQEKGLANTDLENKRGVNKKADKNYLKLDELRSELNSIAEEIVYLSSISGNMNTEKFKSQMDVLQQSYIKKAAELSLTEPSPTEFNRQIIEKENEEQFRDRLVGDLYDDKKSKALGNQRASDNIDKEESERNSEVLKDNIDMSRFNANAIKSLLEQFEKELNSGNITKACELLESAESLSGVNVIATKVKNEDSNMLDNSKEKESVNKKTSIQNELESRVEPDEKVIDKDTLRLRANEVRDRLGSIKDVQKDTLNMTRG